MITSNNTQEEIQNVIDAGGLVEFAPGIYEHAHYRITKPVHLIGHGAILVGGAKIIWQEESDGTLSCAAPVGQPLRTLVVDGALRTRCRLPETGYWKHETVFDVKWLSTTEGGWARKPTREELTTIRVPEGVLNGLTLQSAEATVVHSWSDSLLPISRVDGDTITFEQPADYPPGGFNVHDYCLWNVPEALKKDGTFYHDTVNGKLYYRPLPGENCQTVAYLPEFDRIFYADEALHDIEIEGFTLLCTEPSHIPCGFGAYCISGAVDFGDASDINLHDLTITAVGGSGIRTTGQIHGMQIRHCLIYDVGACGIRVGSNNPQVKSEITDCRVHHVGRYYPSAIAISGRDCNIRHNEVFHTSYSAVICDGNNYTVEKNLIHDAMEVLNDGAAIYSGWSHGSVLRNNLVYGIHPKEGHPLRIAYYLDEQSRGWLVEHNVALDCAFPNHNHMCGENTYRENIFLNSSGSLMFDMQNAKWPCRYIGNVFSAADEIVVRMPKDGVEVFDNNRYHSKSGTIIRHLLNRYDVIEEKPLAMNESNHSIEAVSFPIHDRIFSVEDLTIDLTDVGPRSR
ncbi:MAG: hypothetical protein J6B85_09620 [Lachnospiraceae bacterium]|nr:hypothetical protein [Lachnospiraceae bacterium]